MRNLTARAQRMWLGMVLGGLLPGFLFAQDAPKADPTDLLKVIPKDAAGFIVAPSLKTLDKQVIDVCQILALPVGPNGVFPGPAEFLQQEAGFADGFRPEGGIGVAILNCRNLKTSEEMEDRLVLLLPISDAKVFAESLMAEKEDDYWKIDLAGELMMAAPKGGYMVCAPKAETVKDFLSSEGSVIESMSKDRVEAYGRDEVYGWMSADAFSKELRQEVISASEGFMAMAGGGMQPPGMDNSIENIKMYLEGTKELTFGINVDAKKGVTFAFYMNPKADSKLATAMQYHTRPKGSLLTGLPGEPSVLVYGGVGAQMSPVAKRQIESTMDMLFGPQMLGPILPEEEQAEVVKSLVEMAETVTAFNVSISRLPAEESGGLVGMAVVTTSKDSAKARELSHGILQRIMDTIVKVAKQENMPEEEIEAVKKLMVFKKGEETLAGVKVDHFLVDLSQVPDLNEEDMDQVKLLIGEEGILFRMGAVTENHSLTTFGGGAERFEKIVGLIKETQAPLMDSPGIKLVSDRLPTDDSIMEMYLNFDEAITLVSTIANEMGQPLPLPIQMQNAAPLCMSAVPQGENGLEMHMLIPMELAVSVKDVVMQVMGMMMMGPNGGGEPMPQEQPGGGGELN